MELELTVVNDKVYSDIEGKFRLPLPEGATVVRYAFEINGRMVDALSLPNRKAAEVQSKKRRARKEKGRERRRVVYSKKGKGRRGSRSRERNRL